MKLLYFLVAGLLLGGCKHELVDRDMPAALNFALLDKSGNQLLTSTATPIGV